MYPPAPPTAPAAAPMGAPAMAAPPQTAPQPQQLQMTAEECGEWWKRIELARTRRKRESDKWKQYLKGYLPPDIINSDLATYVNINSNVHFRNAHLKCAEVYAQFPEMQLTPREPLLHIKDPATGQPLAGPDGKPLNPTALAQHIVAVKRELLTEILGPDGADADLMARESLFDIFATSGVAFTKICYESDVQPTPMTVPGPPTQMPGSILGLQDVPSQQEQMVPVVVNERFKWDRFSPSCGLIPHDFHSTKYDISPWLGMEFEDVINDRSKRQYNLPDDFTGNVTRDDLVVSDGHKDPGSGIANKFRGVEIFLRACQFDGAVANFDVFYRLVLIEGSGKESPAIYEMCPYQTVGPDGKLTVDSMIGNPIHPITLRVATDLAWIPADAAFTDPLVRHKNTRLRQMVKQQDSNIPRFLHPASATEAVDKLKQMDTGQGAAVSDELYAQFGEKIIAPIPHLESAQSDAAADNAIDRAMDETLGTGANQAGAINKGQRSATETAIVQQNVSVRLKGERTTFLMRLVAGVRKMDSLAMRYSSRTYVQLEGQAAAAQLVLVDRNMISGRYAYKASADTMVAVDADAQRDNWLKWTNFMAKSPLLDQEQNGRTGALLFGYDPDRTIREPPPPPQPPPEKPRIAFSFSGADLAIPEVRAILQQNGVPMPPAPSPEALMAHQKELMKQMPHGGLADKADTLSEHHQALTGNQDGRPPIGPAQPTPAMPGAGGPH